MHGGVVAPLILPRVTRSFLKSLRRDPEPPRWRRLPRLRARGAVERQRNPLLRAVGDADQALLRAMRTRGHGPISEPAMKLLGTIGEWGAIWMAVGAAAAAADPPRRGRWLIAAGVAPAAVGLNYAVKLAAGRERPLITGHPPLGRAPSKLSFPSAHATSSVAAAMAFGRVAPGSRRASYALAAGICLSRPYLGMHYPSDVLAGAALGLVLGRLVPGLASDDAEERLIELVVSHGEQATTEASSNGAGGAENAATSETAAP
jgi:membrane-associated phospholipid phosphatase